MKKKRVGVYGGTFSPPHIAHVRVAKAFSDALSLDKLLIIPAFLPPHKQVDKNISANTRLEMCRLAFSDIENAEVSDIEIARGGKSYTAITLESLSSDDVELFLLCGTDMFLTLDSWYSPKKIFELATICYVRREEDAEISKQIEAKIADYDSEFSAKIVPIDTDVIEISSCMVREALSAGKDVSSYLPEKVFEYISCGGLYLDNE